jgi:hypothetical protein
LAVSFKEIGQRIGPGGALRIGAWVVFGPITGVLLGLALGAFEDGRVARGWLYVALNVLILLALPGATVLIARTI